MLTFETTQVQGVKAIIEKLTSLPFQKVLHNISSLDAQPASPNGDVIVMVTGALIVDDESTTQRYSQVFHLIPEGGSYFVFNDIFRLNYG
ncbi:Ntf2p [Sugiyamaella lignohabitans]|uniref:Nuclear transport factor 2 n=1 Tax=Sugiyamaella lignohabitans TaxID=796027 RepID=A0A167E293_9ASCO|nr:Ntf2p [Sugiyamaella lignohabitans]ANB13558.1 Ntf2p [Sugiyamaella lignohabitans]